MAVCLDEPSADRCIAVLADAEGLAISAVTVAESLIVAGRRGVAAELGALVDRLGMSVHATTDASARAVAAAYARYGKGLHPAALNFGDCFAYVLAKELACPLLYVGQDFALTDVRAA